MDANLLDFLKTRVALFKNISEEKIDALIKSSRVRTFESNEAIIEFGKEGVFLGIMIEGEAETSFVDDGGLRHHVVTMKPGDVFGEISLMTGDRTMADVIAVGHCRILLIPQAQFSLMLATNPQAIKFLAKLISDRSKKVGA